MTTALAMPEENLPPEGTTFEQEEWLWSQLMLLRCREQKMIAQLTLQEDMIQLQRDEIRRLRGIEPQSQAHLHSTTVTPAKRGPKFQTHKCEYVLCDIQVPLYKKFCGHSHAMIHRCQLAEVGRKTVRKEPPS